ncbi:MAG: HEPN domain-containing protein [Candidatus Anstonellales archaeon]
MFEELERCFEERKLRKTRPDFIKSKKSIESARACLEEAELDLKSGALRSALVMAYASMFHAVRAVLYKDGVQEKSHYCMIRYVDEKYAKKGKFPLHLINAIEAFKEERHGALYGFESDDVSEKEIKEAVGIAKEIISVCEGLIKE